LMIAGGGDDTAWRRLANQLGCSDSVSFLGHVKDVKSLYLSACIFVLPSRGEGLSNALLEAQSYGIPAVVSDIPGNCEVVIHQKTGLVVPVGDAAQLAAEVVRLWVDDDLRERLGGQARRQAIDRFSMRDTANQLVELYSSLMHSQSGRERIVSC
jgi:glycosyltransferase involved in cell wall biosynthesis